MKAVMTINKSFSSSNHQDFWFDIFFFGISGLSSDSPFPFLGGLTLQTCASTLPHVQRSSLFQEVRMSATLKNHLEKRLTQIEKKLSQMDPKTIDEQIEQAEKILTDLPEGSTLSRGIQREIKKLKQSKKGRTPTSKINLYSEEKELVERLLKLTEGHPDYKGRKRKTA